MQYYVKVFNEKTGELVGFYKETGKNCISRLMNGIKYFSDVNRALSVANELNGGFLRDKDKHYYRAYTSVYGDSNKKPPKVEYKSKQEEESELEDELEAFVRKNRSSNVE